jgi:hypothetical protein
MHAPRRSRLALIVAVATTLALPVAVIAAEPGPPPPVVAWQTHLAHVQAMEGPLGSLVKDCIAMHGSMAGQLGPNDAMVEMMEGMDR